MNAILSTLSNCAVLKLQRVMCCLHAFSHKTENQCERNGIGWNLIISVTLKCVYLRIKATKCQLDPLSLLSEMHTRTNTQLWWNSRARKFFWYTVYLIILQFDSPCQVVVFVVVVFWIFLLPHHLLNNRHQQLKPYIFDTNVCDTNQNDEFWCVKERERK